MTSILIQLQISSLKITLPPFAPNIPTHTTTATCVRRLANIYNQISLNVSITISKETSKYMHQRCATIWRVGPLGFPSIEKSGV
jgi:hypothetical protein